MSRAVLKRRSVLLAELSQIVNAMRNLSIAALQKLGKAAEVEREAEQWVLQALADLDAKLPHPGGKEICLIIGSERGFCGGFNNRLAEFTRHYLTQHEVAHCFAAGARLTPLLQGCHADLTELAGCADMEDAVHAVAEWLPILLPDVTQLTPITLIYQDDEGVVARALLPLPALPKPNPGATPLRYLPDAQLTAELISEWLRLALLSRLTRSLTLEHRWRLNQMQRAEHYLEEAGAKLKSVMQRQRQNEITVELENLMSALEVG
ncbi:MAG TPA: F0F1 ATP synthase subunit gamma [Pseudomonadales bacterium]|nr:F0F1 ATP synthase subunit gamma [Pseudomonadales bacterium]